MKKPAPLLWLEVVQIVEDLLHVVPHRVHLEKSPE